MTKQKLEKTVEFFGKCLIETTISLAEKIGYLQGKFDAHIGLNPDVDRWNVSKVTEKDIGEMFKKFTEAMERGGLAPKKKRGKA